MESFSLGLARLHEQVTTRCLKEGEVDDLNSKEKSEPFNFSELLNALEADLELPLTNQDAQKLTEIFQKAEHNDERENSLKLVAELAKVESNRGILVKMGTLAAAIPLLCCKEEAIFIQSLRAIGNTCIDCDAARHQVLDSSVLSTLVEKIKVIEPSKQSGRLALTMYGCMANIAADNDLVQLELIKLGVVEMCASFLAANKSNDAQCLIMAINALSTLLGQDEGLQSLIKCKGFDVLVSMITEATDASIMRAVLDLISDFSENDDVREAACKAGLVSSLVNFIESHECFRTPRTTDDLFKLAADTVVLMTSGDKSFNYIKDDDVLVQRFSEWFNCLNIDIQVSAGLAIGNYARSEEMCLMLINRNIHETLIAFVGTCLLNLEECSNQLQAACSAIKNLVIPAANKVVLGSTPLPGFAVELVLQSSAPVQFKAVAILRLLVQDQSALAVLLCENGDFLNTLVKLAATKVPVGLAAEAQRTIAAFVKNSKSSDTNRKIVKYGGVEALNRLLKAEHVIMQNEAIFALVTVLQSVKESVPVVLESDCLDTIKMFMESPKTEQGILFNILAFLTILHESDDGKSYLHGADMVSLLQTLTSHSQHLVRSRASELLSLLNR